MMDRILKFSAMALFTAACAVLVATGDRTQTAGAVKSEVADVAVVYKAKCAMCHSPKAEKFYDPAKPEADHVQVVLKGKKGEKPPYMPGFEEKGMTVEEATGLVAYMQSLRVPK